LQIWTPECDPLPSSKPHYLTRPPPPRRGGGGGPHLKFSKVFLINFLAKSGNFKHFKKKFKPIFFFWGGGTFFKKLFLINFLAKSSNFKQFSFFSKTKKLLWSLCLPGIFENSGHYICLPSR
jgi:hypothetical protein